MEEIAIEQKKNRQLYRELFLNASKTFKELMESYRSDFSCTECGVCCKIRYSKLSPDDIVRLANEENDTTAKEYLKLFVPYESPLAHEYVDLILSKHDEPVYFYYCKHADDRINCEKSSICKDFPDSITTILPKQCSFRHWQQLIMYKISAEIEPDISKKVQEILDYRHQFKCNRTGTCCKLACSEFTYEELKQKASNNDNFAQQFTSIFIPYTDIEQARKVYPEYVDLVLSTLQGDDSGETANFYHCKHLQGTNTCPVYEDRPQICRDFPDNPFSIIPNSCGYHQWKDEVLVAAYTFYSMTQIYGFYFVKIKAAL
ncbi:MAG: hypothetical protein A2Y25_03010 [Candidatus Melainabacteria bacterium GWF2_37_15]|nr:MAG: hypothetical protein A2Y25_03010 [Candidatus Melainabacteria bacterium GWF2_37_15]